MGSGLRGIRRLRPGYEEFDMKSKSLLISAFLASVAFGGTAGAAVVSVDSDCGGVGTSLTVGGFTCSTDAQ